MLPLLIILGGALALSGVVVGVAWMWKRQSIARVRLQEMRPQRETEEAADRNGGASPTVVKPARRVRRRTAPYVSKREMGKIVIKTKAGSPPIKASDGTGLNVLDANSHFLILGQSGSGKTRRFLNHIIRSYFHGYNLAPGPERERLKFGGFFLDPKAEFVNTIWGMAKEYEREDDIIFFGPDHLDCCYDPFDDPDEMPIQRASKLMAMLKAFNEGAKGQEPFWDNAAEKLFQNIFEMYHRIQKHDPKMLPSMSFQYLGLLLTDRGQARNQQEVDAYADKASKFLGKFQEYSRALADQTVEIIPEMEKVSRLCEEHLRILSAQSDTKVEERAQLAALRTFLEGYHTEESVNINGTNLSLKLEGRLLDQMQKIAQAANGFFATSNKDEQIKHEHVLVRSGDLVRAHVYSRLSKLPMQHVPETMYRKMVNWSMIYDQMLNAFDSIAALQRPESELGALQSVLQKYTQVLQAHGMDTLGDPLYQYFKDEYLNPANDRTAGSVAMFCTNMVNKLIFPPFNEMLRPGGKWSWRDIIDQGKIVVMDMAEARYTVAATLCYILLKTDYFRTCLSRKIMRIEDEKTGQPRMLNQDRELIYMVDEFQVAVTTGKGTGEANFCDRVREYRCSCFFATQALSLILKAVSREEMAAIVANMQTIAMFASADKETIEWFSMIAGKKFVMTGSFGSSVEQTMLNKNEIGAASYTMNMIEDWIVAPHDLVRFKDGEVIIKLPRRFGGPQAVIRTFLELDLAEDVNPDIPVPRVFEPLKREAEPDAVSGAKKPPAAPAALAA